MRSNYQKFLKRRKHPWYRIKKWFKTTFKLPLPLDYKIGLLYGEIAWYKILGEYTEYRLIEEVCTPEEKAEYERLSKTWCDLVWKEDDKNKYKKEWNEYREFARNLHIKYFPHTIEFTAHLVHKPKKKLLFFKGIDTALWNTDACCYSFKHEEASIKNVRNGYLIIKFTLDYLKHQTT